MEGKNNLWLYEALMEVPENAKRAIAGGKLKGKTDINPMWRIKALTEAFGPQGTGWKAEGLRFWTEPGAGGEVAAFACCELRYRADGENWSEPVPGIGGSMLVQLEKGELVTNDEAFKMAYTDAISVAAKGLGAGASVYWGSDSTKYQSGQGTAFTPAKEQTIQKLQEALEGSGYDMEWALRYFRGKDQSRAIESVADLSEQQARGMIATLKKRQQSGAGA